MAKAKAITLSVKKIKLTLSEDEARALVWVLTKVGGEPANTPRRHTDHILSALDEHVAPLEWPVEEGFHAVYFGNPTTL